MLLDKGGRQYVNMFDSHVTSEVSLSTGLALYTKTLYIVTAVIF